MSNAVIRNPRTSRRMHRRATALACVLATAAALAALPSPASAAGTEASTNVYLEADSTKLVVSAPTRLDFAVLGDGTFACPTASAVQLQNGSVFAVRLSGISIEAKGGFSLVDQEAFPTTSQNDALYYTLALGSGSARQAAACLGGLPITTPDGNLTKEGTPGASIGVATAGAIKNVTKDLAQAHEHSQITWTFEAGSNA